MIKKVIINHGGNRDGYQLAKAFAEVDLLHTLITDFYIKLDSPLFKPFRHLNFLNKRYGIDLPSKRIKIPLGALINVFHEQLTHQPHLARLRNGILSKAAFRRVSNSNANLFLYSYTAYEAFLFSMEQQLSHQRFLFQLHPSPEFIKKILLKEIERYPFAEASLFHENEMKNDWHADRLKAEPLLADFIFAASTFTKQSLEATGISSDKIFVVPYGVDHDTFPFFGKREKHRKFRILYVGQFIQRKGVADLLTAMKRLHSHEIELTICTRGFFDDRLLMEFKDLKINIKKDLSQIELLKELHDADLFVFPSLAEGFGFVILEAMHTGLPVITTRHTCGLDIIEDGVNGFLVPPASPEDLANKIEYAIIHKSQLNEIGYQAHVTASTYSWQRFRNEIIEKYLKLSI